MKILSESEVEALVSVEELFDKVAEAFKTLSLGELLMPPRERIRVEGFGDILLMPCLAQSLGVFSLKVVSVYPRNIELGLPTTNAAVLVVNPENGVPELVAEAKALTGLRTAAATALSVRYLARRDASRLGIIGCGYQAGWQLKITSRVMKTEQILVHDLYRERAERLADEFRARTGIDVRVCLNAQELVEACDVIITATTSKTPVVWKDWVRPGTHISAIGAYTPEMAEIDPRVLASAKLVVDSLKAAREEAGDIIQAVNAGLIRWDNVYGEIGEIIAGRKPGRLREDEVTVFKTVGTAAQDAAVASILLSKTRSR
ncbi:MAG: ornithine cyclodeaminase family protein [Nitrososphaerota archaeon]|nr:ornithine cyclodeaminase family protein [Candidatus Calditenuaceae archaeon]MDW8073301.1 ornithine cyclodeaminase family protein [Nitrososphaerota archaeon]